MKRQKKDLRLLRIITEVGGYLNPGEVIDIEVRVPQPDPKRDLYFLTTAKPIFDENKNVSWVICISKNISHRKYLEQERDEHLKELAAKNDELTQIIKHRDILFSIKLSFIKELLDAIPHNSKTITAAKIFRARRIERVFNKFFFS